MANKHLPGLGLFYLSLQASPNTSLALLCAKKKTESPFIVNSLSRSLPRFGCIALPGFCATREMHQLCLNRNMPLNDCKYLLSIPVGSLLNNNRIQFFKLLVIVVVSLHPNLFRMGSFVQP